MNLRLTWATCERVLRQLRRDPRTVALLLVVPPALLVLFRWVMEGQDEAFDRVGGPMVGLFPFITMFVVASVAMLRERTTGTLERLMSMPIGKLDLLGGYGLAFAGLAGVQAVLTTAVGFGLLGLTAAGPIWAVILIAIGNASLGMALGLFVSAFARSEFQAVQFMPAFVLPQVLLAGLIAPRPSMARPLEVVSDALPLTYAYSALARITASGDLDRWVARDVAVIVGFTLLSLALGAATLRRRTP